MNNGTALTLGFVGTIVVADLVERYRKGSRAVPGPYARSGSLGKQGDDAMLRSMRARVRNAENGVLIRGSTPDGAVWGSVADSDAPSGYINFDAPADRQGVLFHDYVPLPVKRIVRKMVDRQRRKIRSRRPGERHGWPWRSKR